MWRCLTNRVPQVILSIIHLHSRWGVRALNADGLALCRRASWQEDDGLAYSPVEAMFPA